MATKRTKPRKPRKDFPLFAHPNGQWAKKIKGRPHYFGTWDDPEGALARYLDDKDDLYAGRVPRNRRAEGADLAELCNRFLTLKADLKETGELTRGMFNEYHRGCDFVIAEFGSKRLVSDLLPEDFEALRSRLAKGRGPNSLAKYVRIVRMLFNYGFEAGVIDVPVRVGPAFKGPKKAILRKARQNSNQMLTPKQVREILKASSDHLAAMALLGLNGGFGQEDCAKLTFEHLDLDAGFIDYRRKKTGIDRRVPLWPRTVKAIRKSIDTRPKPASEEHADLVFLTRNGRPWVRWAKKAMVDATGQEFDKMLRACDCKAKGRGFYALRHTFRTLSDSLPDRPAVDLVMGHEGDDIANFYRHGIDDARLWKVVRHVERTVFGR